MSSIIMIVITVIVTLVGKKFGKEIFRKLHKLSGVVIDDVTREEAAMLFMERHVEFSWRPQIIDTPIVSNVVDFDDLKTKKVKRKKYVKENSLGILHSGNRE